MASGEQNPHNDFSLRVLTIFKTFLKKKKEEDVSSLKKKEEDVSSLKKKEEDVSSLKKKEETSSSLKKKEETSSSLNKMLLNKIEDQAE
jgi:hypothetical protein